MSESEGAATASAETNKATTFHMVKPDGVANLRKKPPISELKVLPPEFVEVIELMTYGLDEAGTVDGELIPAGKPLNLRQACLALGVRLRQGREIASTSVFQQAMNNSLAAWRNAERPRNLHTAIAIRDDAGDNSAATKAVRLKAIQSIEGKDGGNTVNVNLIANQTNNITPGYVIRLPSRQPDKPEPQMVDVTPNKPDE